GGNDVFHSGNLVREYPGKAPPARYAYDPLDVRFADLEKEEIKNEITDQRDALNLFGNGLVYHSEPLERDTEVTSRLKYGSRITLDVPDPAFRVAVYEIKADGGSILLADDRMRARYRAGLRQEQLVRPGEVQRYQFTSFPFISRRLAKGSRLRLVLNSPNS